MAFETHDHKNIPQLRRRLLGWYDKNARTLPWRVGPQERKNGVRPEPYHVWLSEIMLQQTTVATVAPRYDEFLKRWPTVLAMAKAPLDDVLGQWAGLGYYARARNLHKCAVVIAHDHGGIFPDTEEKLKALRGIGDYTAAAIAAIAFDRPAVVIDGNIERVTARLFVIETPLPQAKVEIKNRAREMWPRNRSGDFAQALMDLGATVCKPRAPLCENCPLVSDCDGYALGKAAAFPVKAQKKKKPTRKGAAFTLVNSKGEFLFERRPEKGLLGGMLGLPGSEWTEDDVAPMAAAPVNAEWRGIGAITHVFTHFHLTLDVYIAAVPKGFRCAPNQKWISPDKARLPTVMKKGVELAQKSGRG